MQIYLARNNQQAGPYTLEQVNQMLASQQVLLTDLAWHEGMTEWKALGELTQGKLSYEPAGYQSSPAQPVFNNPVIQKTHVQNKPKVAEKQASIGSRILAKVIDLMLWLPIAAIPSFFLTPTQMSELTRIQTQMQSADSTTKAIDLQNQFLALIPAEAWQAMLVYMLIMLVIQAVLLARTGQSIGKKLANIQIVDANTSGKVNLTRVFLLRSVLVILLTLTVVPFIAIIDALFALGQKRQTLHDMIAKTKVIKRTK